MYCKGAVGKKGDIILAGWKEKNPDPPPLFPLSSVHHLGFQAGDASATATAALAFDSTDTTTTRAWDIKVSQIECSSPYR